MICRNAEASDHGEEYMDIDAKEACNRCTTEIKENGLLLWPVLPQDHGEGLPYAPVNWPNPGDNWGWKVGKRIAVSGFYLDRYLYVPTSFQNSKRKRHGFASKLSVAQYIRSRFPDADVDAFFSSFSWKIPSKDVYLIKELRDSLPIKHKEMAEQSLSDSPSDVVVCKSGNRFCSSLSEEELSTIAATQPCDVCCSESGFCQECCCILCNKTVDFSFGGYSFIRCETSVYCNLICGHVAHINCALRSYMAGTVGGSVGLDTEYYCRRCDSTTDLTEHVTNIWKTCESLESRVDIEKLLSIGSCILRGSQKMSSQRLLYHFESALRKLKSGSNLEDVWKVEVDATVGPGQSGHMNDTPADIVEDDISDQTEYMKLENEIDRVLQELKKSQELEYKIAQERLFAQKDHLLSLYQQLDKEKLELIWLKSKTNHKGLLRSIVAKQEQIQFELGKLKDMEKVAKGFGKVPKNILKEHFDLDPDV